VQRDTKRTKRRLEKSKETEESKKIKKDEKLLNTYMREERKLFLGGQSPIPKFLLPFPRTNLARK
jgi:hypothetical protein